MGITKHNYTIQKGHVLLLAVSFANFVNFILIQGHADIFGSKMVIERIYSLNGQNISILALDFSIVQIEGVPDLTYDYESKLQQNYFRVYEFIEEEIFEKKCSLKDWFQYLCFFFI